MQGIQPNYRPLPDHTAGGLGALRLELTTTTNLSPLAIDVSESTEMRIRRLVTENPVVIFSRSSCCMCHVMKKLLATLGVHPTVIELDEDEIDALPPTPTSPPTSEKEEEAAAVAEEDGRGGGGLRSTVTSKAVAPAVFIGGTRVGGLERLVALHLSGLLVPKLVEVGAYNGYE